MHPGKSVARTVRSILVRRSSDTYFLPALQSGFFYDCGDSIPTIAPVNKIKSFTLGLDQAKTSGYLKPVH